MDIKILYEDSGLIIIDKPAGVVVNRAKTVKRYTIQDWIEKKGIEYSVKGKDLDKGDFYKRSGLVHRLDKETSGILILAKQQDYFDNLQSQFKKRTIQKKYLTLVHGKIESRIGEIKAPISRLPWKRERFGVYSQGKQAHTSFRVKAYCQLKDEDFSFLEVAPLTGRTHQIRVHLKYINHPIVSDSFYAGRKLSKTDRKWCLRLFLHASYIRFKHPERNAWIVVNSSLPEGLQKVINKMERFRSIKI